MKDPDPEKAMAHILAKINHLNGKKRDGFMLAMIEQRSDLRGLPFLMGDDCRTREEDAKVFALAANLLRQSEESERRRRIGDRASRAS